MESVERWWELQEAEAIESYHNCYAANGSGAMLILYTVFAGPRS